MPWAAESRVAPAEMRILPEPSADVLPIVSVPALTVVVPAKEALLPERVSADVALFCTTPVTLAPRAALIRVAPPPVPELVTVPVGLTVVVESVRPLAIALLLLRTRLPVPETPPETVK